MPLRTWQVIPLLAIISFSLTFAELPRTTWPTTAAFSLACGVTALTLMGSAAILGGRWRWVESAFGGLDRLYQTHKWLGVWALGFASAHLVFKASLNVWENASIITLSPYTTRLVRQLSFVALMFIVILALNRNIPYHAWRWWHKLSGPLFVVVILHWLSFKTPIRLVSPAGIWLASVSVLGTAAAAYKLLLYPLLSRHARYSIVTATPAAEGLQLGLESVSGGGLRFEPGQFGFLVMLEHGLREPHPFTIARASEGGRRIELVIRALGDYTSRLAREARAGMQAHIYGPFGRFRRPAGAGREIWIAGGVGISPFIAWLTQEPPESCSGVTLFYFFTPTREFPSSSRLAEIASARGAEFVPLPSGPAVARFSQRFAEIVQESGPDRIEVSFCGPRGLLQRVRAIMREHHIPESRLHYEYFEFR